MNKWFLRFVMYSLIGAALKSDNGNDKVKNITLPKIKGMFEVKHFIPGRIRYKVNILQGNIDINQINFILDSFQKIDGIKDIHINTTIGSILVSYDEKKLQPILISGILIKLLGLEEFLSNKPKSKVTMEVENITNSLNLSVYDKSNGMIDMKNIIMMALLAVSVHKMRTKQSIPISAATSLWWAYSFMR